MTEVKLKIESGKNSAVGIKNNQHETPYYKLHVAKKKKKEKGKKKILVDTNERSSKISIKIKKN